MCKLLSGLILAEVWSCLALQEMGQVLGPIITSFYDVMKCVSTSQTAATQLVASMKSFHELFNLCWSDEFLHVFERYYLSTFLTMVDPDLLVRVEWSGGGGGGGEGSK